MDTIIELIAAGLKNLIPKNYIITSTAWAFLRTVILGQVVIIITQASAIITEILQPQYIKRFRKLKLADIMLSVSLVLTALLIVAAICYLCSITGTPSPACPN